MSKRYKRPVIQHLPALIERDGGEWVCHYCRCNLVPPDALHGDERYYDWVCINCRPALQGDEQMEQWLNGDIIHWAFHYRLKPGVRIAEADHMMPKSRGGSDDPNNLVASCDKCNQRKNNKTAEEFITWLQMYGGAS